jgi:predicted signal transduction protein with EAL and GGDEF domain
MVTRPKSLRRAAARVFECFVAELDGTGSASAVTEAMVRLAQVLHLDTVAEGIEDAAQLTELTLLGCHNGQGFHLARPMEPETVDTWIAGSGARWPSLEVRAPLLPLENGAGSAVQRIGAPLG